MATESEQVVITTPVPKIYTSQEPTIPQENRLGLNQFKFINFSSFLRFELVTDLVDLAHAYANIDPIPDSSVPILVPQGNSTSIWTHNNLTEVMAMILQAGTKVLDAIAFLRTRNLDTHRPIFIIKEVTTVNIVKQSYAVKLAMCAVMIFVSRGSLPASNNKSAQTKLPEFVKSTLGNPNLKTEKDLRHALMSYDPRHINMRNFFNNNTLAGWDPVVCNRLMLGVAGHKPLKIVADITASLPNNIQSLTDPASQIINILVAKNTEANGGFYPNLHPSKQNLANQFPEFYRQCVLAVYKVLPGSDDDKMKILKKVRALSPDEWFKSGAFKNHLPTYQNWPIDQLSEAIGGPLRFAPIDDTEIMRTGEHKPSAYGHSDVMPFESEDMEEEAEVKGAKSDQKIVKSAGDTSVVPSKLGVTKARKQESSSKASTSSGKSMPFELEKETE